MWPRVRSVNVAILRKSEKELPKVGDVPREEYQEFHLVVLPSGLWGMGSGGGGSYSQNGLMDLSRGHLY